jgi:hypothetical protein
MRDDERSSRGPFDFDPTGMWQFMADIQRLGVEMASSVAGRFSRMVEESMGTQAANGPETSGFGPDAQRAVDAWFEMMRASWDAWVAMMRTSAAAWPWPAPGAPHLAFEATPAGGKARRTAYVHNQSDAEAQVSVSATSLVGAAGTIPTEAIKPKPSEVTIPARSTAEVGIKVKVPKDAAPGRYAGVLSATTDPPTEVVMTITVTAADS